MSNLGSAINAAASGLEAQRIRMEVAVSNMANAESTANGGYRRRDVMLAATEPETFGHSLGAATSNASGVKVVGVIEDTKPQQKRFDPSHPEADADGFVSMPNVDVPEEMVNLLGAARAYQANLTAIGLIRDTVQKALELAK